MDVWTCAWIAAGLIPLAPIFYRILNRAPTPPYTGDAPRYDRPSEDPR